MNRQQLISEIKRKKSFLCIGLDTDPGKLPAHLLGMNDPVFEFNKQIIEKTHQYAVAYKPNTAFYEAGGVEGWISLQKTVDYLKTNHPEVFIIADAKRGDIGNTSKMYAKAFLEKMDCDAVTVAPYMGEDSVSPFISYENKWVIILALTSNKGAFDFQFCDLKESQKKLYEEVITQSLKWGNTDNMMYVVGATKAEYLKEIRKMIPDHFLLIPGVGAQGGSLTDVFENGANTDCGLLVNSSRATIYADSTENFATEASAQAANVQSEMAKLLDLKKIS